MADLSERLKLYLVLETDYLQMPLPVFLEEVIKGGVTAVQLRNKGHNISDKLKYAAIIREVTDKYNALFIINDSAELAYKTNADGVHVGASDDDIYLIKSKYNNLITGYSCNNMEDVKVADKYADYAGIGPFTETYTKKDHRHILGAEGIYNINKALHIPAVAIGGINLSNAYEAVKAGTAGLAVSSFLCSSKTPYDDAAKLLEIINE